jgi:hypothetical protein
LVFKINEEAIMKKVILVAIVIVLLAAVAVALVGIAAPATVAAGASQPAFTTRLEAGLKARFTTGKAELQRSFDAKKEVKSFRMKTLLQMHPGHPLETLVEVACPDRERFTTTIGDKAFHAVRIGNKAYVEQQDGKWTVQETPATGWAPCSDNPGEPAPWAVMNEGRDPTAVLAKISANAEIVRGNLIATADGTCQQWVINLQMPAGAPAHGHGNSGLRYTLCVDPNQHLPVSVTMGNGGMVTSYSDWNQPVNIEAPKM